MIIIGGSHFYLFNFFSIFFWCVCVFCCFFVFCFVCLFVGVSFSFFSTVVSSSDK